MSKSEAQIERKANKLKTLEARKEMLFQRFQKLYDYTKDLDDPKILEYFKVGLNNLETSKTQLLEVIDEINLLNLECSPQYIPTYQVVEAADDLYCHIIEASKKVSMNETTSVSSLPAMKAQTKLPKIDLVEFSGDPNMWPIFYQNFKSCVHENPDLDDTCKIHYLLGKLRGRAQILCSGISPVAENYEIIWRILVDTFQDERFLATTYFRSLMEFKQLNIESADNLDSFLEKFDVAVSALKQLSLKDLADFLIVSIALSKLDSHTQRLFEMSLASNEIPSYDNLIKFVQKQSKVLSRTSNHASSSTQSKSPGVKPKRSYSYATASSTSDRIIHYPCPICGENSHLITRCHQFLKLSPNERYKLIKEKILCLNCLSNKHKINQCKSSNSCSVCKSRHHSLLHFNKEASKVVKPTGDSISESNVSQSGVSLMVADSVNRNLDVSHNYNRITLLPTAEVMINVDGRLEKIRVLLDSGSQDNFLSTECCSNLKIPFSKQNITVTGIGNISTPIRGIAQDITLFSRFNENVKIRLDALIIDNLTSKLPSYDIPLEDLSFVDNLPLADSRFSYSEKIDGILGATIFVGILKGDKIIDRSDSLFALNTSLGYVISGKFPSCKRANLQRYSNSFHVVLDNFALEKLLKNFIKLEEVPEREHFSYDDSACEDLFKATYSREPSGRYKVALPFKIDPSNLGDSLSFAMKRFLTLEKRLSSSLDLKEKYSDVFRDYLNQGHMKKSFTLDQAFDVSALAPHYFIPHHAIFKNSTTTPVRVVFDASLKTKPKSLSLNDCLFTGQRLQIDIVQLFLNFRIFKIAIIADLCQMYRQVKLIEDHHRYQRILWRFSPEESVDVYELTTVAFGIKASPFLALRVVKQLASDESKNFPLASKIISRDLYVDDLTTSLDEITDAKLLYSELTDIFRAGGFEITKWHTNSKELLLNIPIEKRSFSVVSFDEGEIVKVLGIRWDSEADILSFDVKNFLVEDGMLSKRIILSKISRIFDPLGILGPVILYAKLFIRQLWALKVNWDSELPSNLVDRWRKFEREIPLLGNISIPRWLGATNNILISLIGFADACSGAYGAAIYSRIVVGHQVYVNLIYSKSKVAPLKVVSIPRLELCAALLLSKLMKYVESVYRTRGKVERIYACSDSQIALAWISGSPHRWQTFVANRVSLIQNNISRGNWFFVQGRENVADIISRGMYPLEFIEHKDIWLSGPKWLRENPEKWPLEGIKSLDFPNDLPEKQKLTFVSIVETSENIFYSLIHNFSSFQKLCRTMVFILRFTKLLPYRKEIATSDIDEAEKYLIKILQKIRFKELLLGLKKGKLIPSKFRNLSPFLDEDEIIRVGGRISNADISFNHKHPYLLPKNEHFVKILIDHYHRKNFHTGSHLLHSLIRTKYWIISGRNMIRQIVRSCNVCFRFKPKASYPLMGNLPPYRVNIALKPFIDTGVDYAGPFSITLTRHRGVKTQKAYICLFVCLATKALHLELASDLSTDTFLDCLKRFLSRRGPIQTLYSDRGTNFVGAKRHLDSLKKFIVSSDYVDSLKEILLKNQINWKFNVPLAPHMGGLWEINVKSMKNHLFKAIGRQILCYEEFATILTQIEALLNSRPLCGYISNDPSDPELLTPAHFTLNTLQCLPAADISNITSNRLNRKQLLDQIVQSYWKRWKNEYLSQLQVRTKWTQSSSPLTLGTVVVLMNENTPVLQWPLGIIVEVFPGRDGIIRAASVKTKHGVYQRPVTKLCPLPTQ